MSRPATLPAKQRLVNVDRLARIRKAADAPDRGVLPSRGCTLFYLARVGRLNGTRYASVGSYVDVVLANEDGRRNLVKLGVKLSRCGMRSRMADANTHG